MKHKAKLITLLAISFIALVLCILNVFQITDSSTTAPIIWAILTICSTSNGITFFKKENKKLGILYTTTALIYAIIFVISTIHLFTV